MRTELPEKWYVIRTPENAQELNDWADSVVEEPETWDRSVYDGYVYSDGDSSEVLINTKKEVEITYEEFTKLVLKKNA